MQIFSGDDQTNPEAGIRAARKLIEREPLDRIWADSLHLPEIGVKNYSITVDGVRKSHSRYSERVNIFSNPVCPVCPACTADIRRFEMATRRVVVCETCQVPA